MCIPINKIMNHVRQKELLTTTANPVVTYVVHKSNDMENVKVNHQGETITGQFVEWFECGLTQTKVGIVKCDSDGKERAFNLQQIKNDPDAWTPHHIGCNCYNCL